METNDEEDDARIRIMHAGPFHKLTSRFGMRGGARRAFFFACLSWATPLIVLFCTQGVHGATLFLADWGAWAKFLVAPVLFTLAEKPIGYALDECCSTFFRIPLVASQSTQAARRALNAARAKAVAPMPELLCLAIALCATGLNVTAFLSGSAPAWATTGDGVTLAGLWCVAIGNTLYWFLLSRLVWKHFIWSRFLSAIARCRLRLAATHPDGHGGLGFLTAYPAGYALFTVALSSVAAAGVGHVMQREVVTPVLFSAVCLVWLAAVASYYAAPLVPIAAQVTRLKRRTTSISLEKVTDFERTAERLVIGRNIFVDEAEPGVAETRDAKAVYLASQITSAALINRSNALPILVPALLPMLIVGASYLSYSQLGSIAKRLLLL